MSFKDYKNSRKQIFQDLKDKTQKEKQENMGTPIDPDDWFPQTDKGGNGMAIIRFMPSIEGENVPMVKWISHFFRYEPTGKVYVENSLRTFGEKNPDPVADYNKKLWDSTSDDNHPNHKQARNQSRKTNVRTNVFVVSDAVKPEFNGKLKKYKFGKQLFDFIDKAMYPPEIEGGFKKEPIDPFDLLEGRNLQIEITTRKVNNNKTERIYSFSWGDAGPLTKDEKSLTKIYDEFQAEPERWGLLHYVDKEKQFKTYDELDARLKNVLGFDWRTGKSEGTSSPSKPVTEAPRSSVSHSHKDETDTDTEFLNKVNSDDDSDSIPF